MFNDVLDGDCLIVMVILEFEFDDDYYDCLLILKMVCIGEVVMYK